jgi:hypothetical protein
MVPGRCGATNLCRYCQTLYVVQTVEMLTLDAMEYAPTVWIVLTAREHLTRSDTYRHLEKLRKAGRKRWPGLEWFVQVEFQRRGALHLNLICKGVPVEDLQTFYEVMTERWCARVDAYAAPFAEMHRGGQWAGAIDDGVGVVRYISKMLAHGLKAEQAPPIGWKGHRTSQTRGYLVRPAWKMRQEARASLQAGRELWKALSEGLEPHDAEIVAHERLELAKRSTWEVVQVVPKLTGEVLVRTLQNREPDAYLRRRYEPDAAQCESWRGQFTEWKETL